MLHEFECFVAMIQRPGGITWDSDNTVFGIFHDVTATGTTREYGDCEQTNGEPDEMAGVMHGLGGFLTRYFIS